MMEYGDFSSVVQLGVGLHVGTALLQIYGEIGLQPFIRSLSRIRRLVEDMDDNNEELVDQLDAIEGDFEIFRIRLSNEYKWWIITNSLVAVAPSVLLVFISYNYRSSLPAEMSIFIVALAVLPAPITLSILWNNATKAIAPLMERVNGLEDRALRTFGGRSTSGLDVH
jgi:hypothetical protein